MEIALIVILIIFNGLLSMIEIALISLKRTRLKHLQSEGDKRAEVILRLLEDPNHFFSTIQVGITLIGILTGALGGITLSEPVDRYLQQLGVSENISETLSFTLVVLVITYLSIVIGELVPKRIGLEFPEGVALWTATPVKFLSRLFDPVVTILSGSTAGILKLFHIKRKRELPISGEEIKLMVREGAQLGVFEAAERSIVEKTLNLSEIKVNSLMTSRNKIVWIEKDMSMEEIKKIVLNHSFSYFPVCNKELDNIIGIISADSLLSEIVTSKKPDYKKLLHKPILIPETKKVLQVLELFKRTRIHMGLVLDEYGNIQGLISVTDILEAIVGDLPDLNEKEERKIIKRSNNSWFVDGLLSTNDFKEHFQVENLPNEDSANFHTIGGFVMDRLGKVPVSGDYFRLNGYKVEVVDMDGNRVDKVLVTREH